MKTDTELCFAAERLGSVDSLSNIFTPAAILSASVRRHGSKLEKAAMDYATAGTNLSAWRNKTRLGSASAYGITMLGDAKVCPPVVSLVRWPTVALSLDCRQTGNGLGKPARNPTLVQTEIVCRAHQFLMVWADAVRTENPSPVEVLPGESLWSDSRRKTGSPLRVGPPIYAS